MNAPDDVAIANRKLWEMEVQKGCGYTIPWLDINRDLLLQFANGECEMLPEPMEYIFPANIFANIKGKDVLCLAAGGGQQSAIFGLLGAHVTVVDMAKGQLDGDRKAADHYGYEIRTLRTDMRDLSELDADAYDLVFQANSMAYVPDVQVVYEGVARVLRSNGLYRVDCFNPATFFMEWDGTNYVIKKPYHEKINKRNDGGIEFRHYLDSTFNGLIDAGFSIERIHEEPFFRTTELKEKPGSWNHMRSFVAGGFVIIARRQSL